MTDFPLLNERYIYENHICPVCRNKVEEPNSIYHSYYNFFYHGTCAPALRTVEYDHSKSTRGRYRSPAEVRKILRITTRLVSEEA